MKQTILTFMILIFTVSIAFAEPPKVTFSKRVLYTYLPADASTSKTVNALDINGTDLYLEDSSGNKTLPTVTLGGQSLNIIYAGPAAGSSTKKQIVVRLESAIMGVGGVHLLKVATTNGTSSTQAVVSGSPLYLCPIHVIPPHISGAQISGGSRFCQGLGTVSSCMGRDNSGNVTRELSCRLVGFVN